MVLQYPIALVNGRPQMANGNQVLEHLLEAVLSTDEGTYFVDRRYGISLPLFGPTNMDAAILSFELSEEILERMEGVSLDSITIQPSNNSVEYLVQISKASQVVTAKKQVLL